MFFNLLHLAFSLGGLAHKALQSLAPSVFCEPLLDEKPGAEAGPREREGNDRPS